MYSNIYVGIGSASYSLHDDITSIYASLINYGRVELSSDLLLIPVPLRDSNSKFTSSNCANMIIPPVNYFEDLAYGMYDTAGRIAIASEYGYGMYSNSLEKIS